MSDGRVPNAPVLDLIGRTSQWRRRMRADGQGSVLAAWLRLTPGRGGVVGVYLPDTVDPATLPNRTQAHIQAYLAPLVVHAIDGDHLLPDAPQTTMLLLGATSAQPWDRITPPLPWDGVVLAAGEGRALDAERWLVTLPDLPGVWGCGAGPCPAPGQPVRWHAVSGVSVALDQQRYLRPLVVCVPPDQGGAPWT